MDALATLPHYRDHLRPVWEALPEGVRGQLHEGKPETAGDVCLVASYSDQRLARKAGYTRFVVMEHGAGQSYSNDHPAYPGGRDRGDTGLFLTPNAQSAARWRAAYPRAAVEVVGCPRLDGLPDREAGPTTVAISFHTPWADVAPEASSAFGHFRAALPELARSVTLIGHGHPRANYGPTFAKLGLAFVPTFDEVCRRADVYVCDNSSTLFEFASTGRPVIVLNGPQYRRDARHGLRFEGDGRRFIGAADVGLQCDEPGDLLATIELALKDSENQRAKQETALEIVYAYRNGAAARAADAITDWMSTTSMVAA